MNLYTFSWASLITCIQILSAYNGLHSSDDIEPILLRRVYWTVILKVCIVIVASADHISKSMSEYCTNEDHSKLSSSCFRTELASVLGKSGLIVSTIGFFTNFFSASRLAQKAEVIGTCLIFLLNFSGVIFNTSTDGPGEAIGNLFFFSWLNFGMAVSIANVFVHEKNERENDVDGTSIEMRRKSDSSLSTDRSNFISA